MLALPMQQSPVDFPHNASYQGGAVAVTKTSLAPTDAQKAKTSSPVDMGVPQGLPAISQMNSFGSGQDSFSGDMMGRVMPAQQMMNWPGMMGLHPGGMGIPSISPMQHMNSWMPQGYDPSSTFQNPMAAQQSFMYLPYHQAFAPGMRIFMQGREGFPSMAPEAGNGATPSIEDKKQSSQPEKSEPIEKEPQIKRPANSFLTFASEWRPKIQAKHPNAPNALISKYLGDKWKSMSKAEKAVYILQSEEVRKEFHRQHPDFVYSRSNKKKRKTSGGSNIEPTIKK